MPINPKLKEQLEKTPMDDAYRQTLIATLDNAPAAVQNLWMAQDDYTRQANALKTEKEQWKVKADKFYTDSNAAVEAWKTEVQNANDALAAAKAELAALQGGGGPVRTPAQEDAAALQMKKLTEMIGGLETKISGFVTPDKLDQAYQSAVGFIGDQLLTVNELQAQHQEKFGKRLTKPEITELIEFANEQSKAKGYRVTLEEAYSLKNDVELKKLERAQIEKEITDKINTQRGLPTDAGVPGGPSPAGKGPLEVHLEQHRNRVSGGGGDKGYATWQEAAAAGAKELVDAGKG